MRKFLVSILFVILGVFASKAQEIQAKVSINASRVNTTVDKKIFVTLQNQLTNFLNSRKWTNDKFNENERIQCSFLLNLESGADVNIYKASLIIQAARPVYNSSYQAALVNFQDQDVTFKYIEYQPIEFNENRVQGSDPLAANLTATLAYYVYVILGFDYDSFAPKGGDKYFAQAINIVNNAPEGSNISGWRAFDGLRNRYWLAENLTNSSYNIVHDIIYSYYRSGLDKMYDNDKEARGNILQALNQLQAFNREHQTSMFVQFFMQTKTQELIGVFAKGTADEKSKATELLSVLDAANSSLYKEKLR